MRGENPFLSTQPPVYLPVGIGLSLSLSRRRTRPPDRPTDRPPPARSPVLFVLHLEEQPARAYFEDKAARLLPLDTWIRTAPPVP